MDDDDAKPRTALYLLPAMIGGIGVYMTSHVLIQHLFDAERRFDSNRHNENT